MRIKRFFAPDVRRAINMVRSEFGPDAVILSNTRVSGGVEIVSAIDYDETLYSLTHSEAGASGEDSHEKADQREDERPVANPAGSQTKVVWEQDPALTALGQQIKSMRNLLESQLTQLAWDDLDRRHPLKAQLIQRLLKLDLGMTLCRRIANKVPLADDVERMWQHALALLAHAIPVMGGDCIEDGGIVALVGPTGVGKTTTIAKLAARYALKHGRHRVALVTTDNYRIGAYEQLSAYGRILDVPVRLATGAEELRDVLGELCDKELVLVDTAGMGQRDLRLSQQLAILEGGKPEVRTLLVVSAATRFSGMEEIMQSFRQVRLSGAIVTKLDEATGVGGVVTSLIKHQLAIAYIGNGQRVPEDIHIARGHTIVSQGVTIMRQLGRLLDEEGFTAIGDRATQDAGVQ